MKKAVRKSVRIAGLLLVLLTLILLILGIINRVFVKDFITQKILLFGFSAIFVITFFFDLFPQYLSGHTLILISAILKLNIFHVVLVVLAAALLASIVGFWIGRYVEESFFEDLFGETLYRKIKGSMNKYGKWYACVSAISPLPYVPMIFGALGMDAKNFFLYGVTARLFGFIVTGLFSYYALPWVLGLGGFG